MGVTAIVAREVAYGGLWRLGVGATGVAGLQAHTRDGWGDEHRVSSDLEVYERFTSASTSELVEQPGLVTERGGSVRAGDWCRVVEGYPGRTWLTAARSCRYQDSPVVLKAAASSRHSRGGPSTRLRRSVK